MPDFLQKLQQLSEGKKKIIIWSVAAAAGLTMVIVWFILLPGRFQEAEENEFFQELETSIEENAQEEK